MDQLKDILSNRFDEPEEIGRIKQFIKDRFKTEVSIMTHNRSLIILVPSAGLAGTLRLHFRALKKAADTDKNLSIRIQA